MAVINRREIDLAADRGPRTIQIIIAIGILTTTVVIARLISRKLQKTKWNASDYTIVLGLMGCWALTAVTIVGEILYGVLFSTIKISILLLYRTLFPGRQFAILTVLVGSFVVAWGMSTVLLTVLHCRPINGFWNFFLPSVCIDPRKSLIFNSVPNVLADVFILALPVHKVWHLKLSRKSKILVSCLFLLGALVCVVSGIRFYSLTQFDEKDVSWTDSSIAVWSVVEVDVAVISACLPTIRPLIRAVGHAVPSFTSWITEARKSSLEAGPLVAFNKNQTQSTFIKHQNKRSQDLPEAQLDTMSALETPNSIEHKSMGSEL